MTHDESEKNNPGGLDDTPSAKKEARMYSCSKDPDVDGLSCLKKFVSKLNPGCEALFQYPRAPQNLKETDQVWYDRRPLGITSWPL